MLVLARKKQRSGTSLGGRIALLVLWGCAFSSAADALAQPVIKSIFPSAAQKGSTVTVEFRGTGLEGAYALWADSPSVAGAVKPAESADGPAAPQSRPAAPDNKPTSPAGPVVLQLRVDAAARPGTHAIRLVSPHGLSNAIAFFVAEEPVEVEAVQAHHTPREAQSTRVPALIQGRMDQSGQVDCYACMASEGDEL
ncbi:MAG: hypothetical protein ACKV0T_02370 [Planctomycetales bacterium]